MTECPTCGRDDFKNEDGMKYHHARVHGESLRLVTEECYNCGEDCTRRQSIADQNQKTFCDKKCQQEWRNDNNIRTNKKEHKKIECENCGCSIVLPPSKARQRRFCSRSCYAEWRSEHIVGKNHPMWEENTTELTYGSGWKKQRQKRLEKDDYECVVCGKTQEEEKKGLGRSLSVHHIEKLRIFLNDDGTLNSKRAHRIDNLITLCTVCHNKWEKVPLKPQL